MFHFPVLIPIATEHKLYIVQFWAKSLRQNKHCWSDGRNLSCGLRILPPNGATNLPLSGLHFTMTPLLNIFDLVFLTNQNSVINVVV